MSWQRSLLPGVLVQYSGCSGDLGYVYYVRPKMIKWGATDEEIGISLAGDELEPTPKICSTFAITIETPALGMALVGADRTGAWRLLYL